MSLSQHLFTPYMDNLKKNGGLTVSYALLAEALILGYTGFFLLLMLEILFPTLIADRINLSLAFAILMFFSLVLGALGQALDVHFTPTIHKKSPLLWIGLFLIFSVSMISLYTFPWPIMLLVTLSLLWISQLFWRTLINQK
ncbi:MAG: hypothetical protein ACSLEX_02785 [Minisyncoccota bacterium]